MTSGKHSNLLVGEYIAAPEGIGQVLSVSHYFVEEYCSEFRNGAELGAPLRSIVIYKVFCDFEGTLRRRQHVRSYNATAVSRLDGKSRLVFAEAREADRSAYESFDALEQNTVLPHKIRRWFDVPVDQTAIVGKALEDFSSQLRAGFSIQTLLQFLSESVAGIDFATALGGYSRPRDNVYVTLFNDDYIVQNRRAVFSGLEVHIR